VQCPGDCGFCPDDPIKPEIPQFGVRGGGCSAGKNYGNGLFVLIIMFVGLLLFRKYAKFLLILAILIAPSAVYAQNFNSERFEPGAGSDSILSVETGTTDPEGSMGSYLWLNVSDDPLVFENLNTEERIRKFVNYKAMVGFGFNYSPHDLLQFNVAVPFVMSQEATSSLTDTTMDIDAALGDVSVTPKFMLLRGNLPVALSAKLTLPTASSDNFVGSSDFSISPMLAASFSHNRWRTALNVGYRTRDDSQFLDLAVSDEMFAALGLAYGWGNGSEVAATLSAAVGADNPFDKANQNYAESMLGYRRFLTPDVSWFMGVGRGLSEGFGAPDWRGVVGLRIRYDNTKNDVVPVPPKPVPEPEPVPQPEPEPEPEEPIKLVIPHTYFNFDKAEIRSEYRQLLLDFAESADKYMSKYPDVDFKVFVIGATDSIGSKKYNYRLGDRRAQSVALVLAEGGISPKTIIVLSDGEDTPIASNKTKEGRAKNRTVLIWVSNSAEVVKWRKNEPTPETYDNF
jgi:outer membrane protein OmpA-like peptidoglycan-associated protein